MMGFYGFLLEHDGNVYSCFNGQHVSFGNLLTNSFESVWYGKQAHEARRQVRAARCPTCPETTYSSPVNALEVVETVVRVSRWRSREQAT
jgi:radical SAM protein with 4Fe4S-binding SPASM domain